MVQDDDEHDDEAVPLHSEESAKNRWPLITNIFWLDES